HADGVRESLAIRQHRMDRPPSKLAVADFAAAGRAESSDLAHRIRWEIVVQHEGLFVGALKRVDILLILAGAERRHHQSLRLAAGEQRAAVRAWQDADFADDR